MIGGITSNSVPAYVRSSQGPRQLPWGTLHSNHSGFHSVAFTLTRQLRGRRYESTRANTVPFTPYWLCNTSSRMVWSTVSKAAQRSIAIKAVTSCFSIPSRRSLTSLSKAVTHEWWRLCADWFLGTKLYVSIWLFSLSSSKETISHFDNCNSKPDFLRRCLTIACFQCVGNTPLDKDRLTSLVMVGTSSSRCDFNICVGNINLSIAHTIWYLVH